MFISEDEKEPREEALKKLIEMMSEATGKRLSGLKDSMKPKLEIEIEGEGEGDSDDDSPFDNSDNEDDHDFDTTDDEDTQASFAHGGEVEAVKSVTDRWQNDNGAGGLSEAQKAMIADLYNKHCR